MKIIKRRSLVVIAVVLISMFAGYNFLIEDNIKASPSTNSNKVEVDESSSIDPNKVEVHASWGDEFPDVQSLIKSSDIILVAELEESLNSYQPFNGYEDTFTDATISPIEMLKGEIPKERLIISQYGGVRKDGKFEEFHDFPLLEKDKKYLLFLEKIEDSTERNGKYQAIRGIQGFYTLDEVKSSINSSDAKSLNINAPNKSGITKKVVDLELSELKSLINE
ncbi:hypothetical protein ERJ70_16325 [Sediminibacillus dalangtanensis]|uniref:Uncharacterized protein n=1 Tax=Sediminibacillus dalangtanensis TaxID=2729421 RepID=A0ABX7VVZ0_9BACI|nr:hypothetical protein [Sediminibacillus dalangtanensis]QTN00714.1 hypothetical protein ERJ70_16325 [Sediminibacillus dalangtanensis]